ncbi:hypothetical protein Bca4012_050773 [Brassica carinata]
MNPNGESPVFDDLISKKPNGKDSVSSDEPIKGTGQSGVSSAKAVSGDSLSKKPNGKTVAVPKKKGRYVGLARSTGGASSSSSAHYPLVDELMEQIKTKDTEIEFLKQDNAEIRVELQQNRTTMEENNGGDLIKWDKARIGFYVGIDIAEGLKIVERVIMVMQTSTNVVELDKILEEDAPIVICSCQLKVWRLLIVYTGFVLVNGFLKRNSNLAAPLVSNTSFTLRLTLSHEQYDLELVFVKNSHEFVHEYMKKTEFVELMRRLGALGDGNQDQSTLSTDEWDTAYLYLSFVLRKRGGESDGGQRIGERRKNG